MATTPIPRGGFCSYVRTTPIWLNHIHIADQIFKSHLIRQLHGLSSTESDSFPLLLQLQESAKALDEWLIDYAKQLDNELAPERIDFVFTDGDKGCMSRAEMLIPFLTHGHYT
ncbi:DinB family protein [Nitrosospira sp. Nsp13]|uniref:DinB family protein n=1 Tax=Nitrosospira sp. Nsp13 TaxID=1855332 RepID=UPI0015863793|nr:hypothetical protein [Nitrosospira sp. Nsp13]